MSGRAPHFTAWLLAALVGACSPESSVNLPEDDVTGEEDSTSGDMGSESAGLNVSGTPPLVDLHYVVYWSPTSPSAVAALTPIAQPFNQRAVTYGSNVTLARPSGADTLVGVGNFDGNLQTFELLWRTSTGGALLQYVNNLMRPAGTLPLDGVTIPSGARVWTQDADNDGTDDLFIYSSGGTLSFHRIAGGSAGARVDVVLGTTTASDVTTIGPLLGMGRMGAPSEPLCAFHSTSTGFSCVRYAYNATTGAPVRRIDTGAVQGYTVSKPSWSSLRIADTLDVSQNGRGSLLWTGTSTTSSTTLLRAVDETTPTSISHRSQLSASSSWSAVGFAKRTVRARVVNATTDSWSASQGITRYVIVDTLVGSEERQEVARARSSGADEGAVIFGLDASSRVLKVANVGWVQSSLGLSTPTFFASGEPELFKALDNLAAAGLTGGGVNPTCTAGAVSCRDCTQTSDRATMACGLSTVCALPEFSTRPSCTGAATTCTSVVSTSRCCRRLVSEGAACSCSADHPTVSGIRRTLYRSRNHYIECRAGTPSWSYSTLQVGFVTNACYGTTMGPIDCPSMGSLGYFDDEPTFSVGLSVQNLFGCDTNCGERGRTYGGIPTVVTGTLNGQPKTVELVPIRDGFSPSGCLPIASRINGCGQTHQTNVVSVTITPE
jgi:hypothetical protein